MKTQIQRLVLSTMAAAALALFTGCASDDNRTAGRAYDDWRVSARVKDALNDSPIYKFGDVDVSTRSGVVQLSGWVGSEEQKGKATEVAQSVDGVREVINNIAVRRVPTGRDSGYPHKTNGTEKLQDGRYN